MTLLEQTLYWFRESAHWSGAGGIPQRLMEHLMLTGAVIGIAAVLALPIGIIIGHRRKGGGAIISLAGAARAIPTLGLLTLLGLALGIGLTAPMIALVVLAIPPLLAGAYAGVANVDAITVRAARAMGMSEWQIIRSVEIPLAAPLLIGGFRAAVVQVIATATLAAYISDTGLGRYIFAGLKSRDYGEMIGGAVLVVILSLVADAAFSLLFSLLRSPTPGRAATRRNAERSQ